VSIAKRLLLWLITLFLAYIFLRQGVSKFSDTSGWAGAFRAWHFPDWFRVLIGVVEVAAAVLLFVPRLVRVGAVMIVVVMLGGMATHVWWGHPRQMTSEVLPLVLATVLAVVRR
jgi:putative oxidoreductase